MSCLKDDYRLARQHYDDIRHSRRSGGAAWFAGACSRLWACVDFDKIRVIRGLNTSKLIGAAVLDECDAAFVEDDTRVVKGHRFEGYVVQWP